MPASSSARSSAKSSGAAGAFSGSSSTAGARDCSASATCSSDAPTASATSAGVGRRPSRAPISTCARRTRPASSTTGRGVRTSCARSRRWWRISPSMAGHGDRPQVAAARRLEAVDRLDEADGADLHEVVDGLASACIAARDGAHEAHVLLDEARSRLLMPPRHDPKVAGLNRSAWVNFRPVSPWFHRWLQGTRAPLGGMKRAMAGVHDLLRRSALLGALVAAVVFLMAPAARADDASAAVAAATGAAVAEQAQPANVNVSVRVDSPGENGTVAQANTQAQARPVGSARAPAAPRRVPRTSTSRSGSTAPETTAR